MVSAVAVLPLLFSLLAQKDSLPVNGGFENADPHHGWELVVYGAQPKLVADTEVKREDGTETTFRQLAIDEIDKVVWDPAWGKERITNMIATRPDWCISRQRIWGVPIAVFMCAGCDKPIVDAALNRKIVGMFEREGVEAWHTTPLETLLPEKATCAHCGGTTFRKETDILDVWFDSGTSWFAVCESD